MSRIAKAKACPFCRSTSNFVECQDFGSFYVMCNDCGAQGPTAEGDGCDDTAENYAGRRNAIRAWNRRPRAAITQAPASGKAEGGDA